MKIGRRRGQWNALLLVIIVLIVALWGLIGWIRVSPNEQAERVVRQFYEFEQEARFSESWELFHPLMKERFAKGDYIQERAHVFMSHFGVETFSFSLGSVKKMENWKGAEESAPLKAVYQVPVIQMYQGKFGNFSLHQEVFVTEHKGEWLILWDYE
ncbi:hypothetical protein [Bacillus sp. REN10]|uniref:hypothetical protein n=1 Tax=Bacillus sp. REN10 TaxID=2782541 RepID=UPI001EED676F|nr:hypothetical protein [Bacillus sp. REN10]